MAEIKECENLEHDFRHAVRKGRANYICPLCGAQLMLLMVFMYEADINPRETDCPVPNKHKEECACSTLNGVKNPKFDRHSKYECDNKDTGILKA